MSQESATNDESAIRAATDGRDHQRAASLTLERYGRDIFGFLVARTRSTSDASEVFSMFAEDLWKGLPGFQWRCSMRTFCYTIARNAANRYATAPANRKDRNVGLSQMDEKLSQLAERVRSETAQYMRSEAKDQIRQLREQLDPEEQTLLFLRIDRNLPWREVAAIMSDDGEQLGEQELAREGARLRKRFQVVKERLRSLAQAEGLL